MLQTLVLLSLFVVGSQQADQKEELQAVCMDGPCPSLSRQMEVETILRCVAWQQFRQPKPDDYQQSREQQLSKAFQLFEEQQTFTNHDRATQSDLAWRTPSYFFALTYADIFHEVRADYKDHYSKDRYVRSKLRKLGCD